MPGRHQTKSALRAGHAVRVHEIRGGAKAPGSCLARWTSGLVSRRSRMFETEDYREGLAVPPVATATAPTTPAATATEVITTAVLMPAVPAAAPDTAPAPAAPRRAALAVTVTPVMGARAAPLIAELVPMI